MSDLTEYIGARQSRLYGETHTTSAGPPSHADKARVYLDAAVDPELSPAGQADARYIGAAYAQLAHADSALELAHAIRAELAAKLEWHGPGMGIDLGPGAHR